MRCKYPRPENPNCREEVRYIIKTTYTNNAGRKIKEDLWVCEECLKYWRESRQGDERYKVRVYAFEGLKDCDKCGGSGQVPIAYAEGVCFKCGGSGKSRYPVKKQKDR